MDDKKPDKLASLMDRQLNAAGMGVMPGAAMAGMGVNIPKPDMSGAISMIDRQIKSMEEQKKRVVEQLDTAIQQLKEQRENLRNASGPLG